MSITQHCMGALRRENAHGDCEENIHDVLDDSFQAKSSLGTPDFES
jgi:hypothetical protein